MQVPHLKGQPASRESREGCGKGNGTGKGKGPPAMSVLSLWPFPTSWGEVYRVGTNSAFLPKTGFSREDKGVIFWEESKLWETALFH